MRIGLLLLVSCLCFSPLALYAADQPTILTESASGTRSLRPFTVGDRWELQWDSSDGLIVWLMTEKGTAVQQLAAQHKPGKGSTFHPTGGSYYLRITSSGDWTVRVVQLP